ncbi:MAG: lysozyme [bacterium]
MDINKIIEEEVKKNLLVLENEELNEGWKDQLAKTFAAIALGGALSSVKLPDKKVDFDVNKPKMDLPRDISQFKKTNYDSKKKSLDLKTRYINHINSLKVSEEGQEEIKKHEVLKLRGYRIGDGMITIGWGHAEPIGRSKFSVGEKITKKTAEILFQKDLKVAEDGVKRILLEWYKKDNVKLPLSQNMFDALVSMAYNMGVYGLKSSKFMEELKNSQDPEKSAEKIKTSRVGKWKGLKVRRQHEYNLFTAGLNQYNKNLSKFT